MTNGAIEALLDLFDALMVMAPVVPSSWGLGVPIKEPVLASNLAQAGCPTILNITRVLLPETVGVNEY
jgi:hypothetical protein